MCTVVDHLLQNCLFFPLPPPCAGIFYPPCSELIQVPVNISVCWWEDAWPLHPRTRKFRPQPLANKLQERETSIQSLIQKTHQSSRYFTLDCQQTPYVTVLF